MNLGPLTFAYKNFVICASRLGDYQKLSKQELGDGYIKYENDPVLGEAYYSAIVLRYWGYIGHYYEKSKASGFSIEDCYSWLLEAIHNTFYYRPWVKPDNKLYKDPNGFDKVINRCVYSVRQLHYYESNLQKRKGNFNKVSLDALTKEVGDSNELLKDENYSAKNNVEDEINLRMLLQHYINKNNPLYSLVLYSICKGDCYIVKVNKEGENIIKKKEFKINRLVSFLNDKENTSYITNYFGDEKENIINTLKEIQSFPKPKLKRIIEKAMNNLSKDKYLKEVLCY